jgi:HSP20 family protein
MLPVVRTRSFLPRFADDFFEKNVFSGFFEENNGLRMPAVNVSEEKDDFKIEVAAPGLEKEDFKIDLDNNLLTISCEKEEKHEDNGKNYMRREFNYTSFKRSFSLPESVNADKIKAQHKNGILEIEIPKKEEAKLKPVKQIKIN